MAYVKAPIPSVVYHLTKKENLDSILETGMICRFADTECWFCESLDKMKAYMEQTVMCEGKPYYAVGGRLCRYPKFISEDYVILSLAPHWEEDNWYRWNQEVPPNSPKALVKAAREFSQLKIGYRGDLWFDEVEVIDVSAWLDGAYVSHTEIVKDVALDKLRDKITNEIGNYYPSMGKLSFKEVMDRAEEIAVTELCRRELMDRGQTLSRKEILRLLDEEKPLERLRNAWTGHHTDELFRSVLDEVCNEAAMSKTQDITPKNVRELLKAYPQDNFRFMTPFGYVDLTPTETRKLLRGESVVVHSGASDGQMGATPKEVLELEIKSVERGEDGCWYVLTDYGVPRLELSDQEQEPQMTM